MEKSPRKPVDSVCGESLLQLVKIGCWGVYKSCWLVGWLVGCLVHGLQKLETGPALPPQQLPGVQVGNLNEAKRQTARTEKKGECKGMQQECSVMWMLCYLVARCMPAWESGECAWSLFWVIYNAILCGRCGKVNIHPDWDCQIENNKSNAQIKRAQACKQMKTQEANICPTSEWKKRCESSCANELIDS